MESFRDGYDSDEKDCRMAIPFKIVTITSDTVIETSNRKRTEMKFGEALERILELQPRLSRFADFFRASPSHIQRRMMLYMAAYTFGGVVTRRKTSDVSYLDLIKSRQVVLLRDREGVCHTVCSPGDHPLFLEVLEAAVKGTRGGALDSDLKERLFLDSISDKYRQVRVATSTSVAEERSEHDEHLTLALMLVLLLVLFAMVCCGRIQV